MKESQNDRVNSAEPGRRNECETTGTRYSEKEMIAMCMHRTLSEASTDKLLDCSIRCAKAKSCCITNGTKRGEKVKAEGEEEEEEENEEHEMQQIKSRKYFEQVKSKRGESIKQIGRSLYQMSCDFHQTHFANNV